MVVNFQQRKKDVLLKEDKSSKKSWDEKIKSFCEKINSSENYYTTSSCSGRIILMIDSEKKQPGLFKFVSHEKIDFDKLKIESSKIENKNLIKFKQEPPIIHIVCEDLESAEKILNLGRECGWKRSGILNLGKNIVVELNLTEKLEFPIIDCGKILVDDYFLNLIVKKANENLEKGWRAISLLEESI